MDYEYAQGIIARVLADKAPKLSQTKRAQLTQEIAQQLGSCGCLTTDEQIGRVEIVDAMVPVRYIEQYGLVIAVDANERAVDITSERPMVVIA